MYLKYSERKEGAPYFVCSVSTYVGNGVHAQEILLLLLVQACSSSSGYTCIVLLVLYVIHW